MTFRTKKVKGLDPWVGSGEVGISGGGATQQSLHKFFKSECTEGGRRTKI
jgi:hypothetical protein